MKITKSHFKDIVRRFITVIDRENIDSLDSLDDRVYDKLDVDPEGTSFIEIDLRPSNRGTEAYKMSYIVPNTGIPLEVSINASLEYTQLIVKMQEPIAGYTPFSSDPFGNIQQNKLIYSIEMSSIREELKMLLLD